MRPVGQAVKTSPSHGENRGSSPLRVTIKRDIPFGMSLFVFIQRDSNPERAFCGLKKLPVASFSAKWCADGYCAIGTVVKQERLA